MSKTSTLQISELRLDAVVIDEDLDFRSTGSDITELAASILEHGLLQPIVVAPANGDGKHHVIAGRRRFRAHEHLGLKTIPAIIREDMAEEQAQVVGQIIENLQRTDVSPLDEAHAYSKLLSYDIKQKDIAAKVGVSAAHVSGRLALLKLPEKLVDQVANGRISAAVATKIARAPLAVREAVAKSTVVDERTLASCQREYDQVRDRQNIVDALVEAGVPAATQTDGWGYMKSAAKAEVIGLTDDDKPKTHSWDDGGSLHLSHYDSQDDLVAAVVKAKPKGAYVAGNGGYIAVHLVTSANLDKVAKAQAEEREARLAEQRAKEQAEVESFNKALAPLIAAPNKAKFIALLLQESVKSSLNTYSASRLDFVTTVAERLGLDCSDLVHPENDNVTADRVKARLFEHSTKSAVDAMKVILAASTQPDELLATQGFFDHYDISLADPYEQHRAYTQGWVTKEQLDPDVRAEIETDEADEAAYEAEQEAYEQRVSEAVDAAVAAKKAEDGVDELDDAELEAIEVQVRDALDAEDAEAGDDAAA